MDQVMYIHVIQSPLLKEGGEQSTNIGTYLLALRGGGALNARFHKQDMFLDPGEL